jgi:arylsulfatase A-like enzyme/Flp pilus assembly protein TadD
MQHPSQQKGLLRLFSCASALATIAGCNRPTPEPREWNVVVVTLDTTRADRIGAFGGKAVPTPSLDRAAAEGTRFLDAVSPVPLTLPAHTSIFTGQYPFHHGVRHNGTFHVPPSAVTLAERLRDVGFRTGAFVGSFVLDASFGLDQGFETYSGVSAGEASADFLRPSEIERNGAAVNAAALPWIDAQEGRRFFAWIHYYDPHHPYAPPSDPSLALQGTGYDREISYVDHCFGELVAHLKEKGLLDRTLLVVAGDHGESLGAHGESYHGVFLYEPAVHVPLLFRAPGLVPGHESYRAPVSLIDLAPTVLSLLGLSPFDKADGTALFDAAHRLAAEKPHRVVFGETWLPRIELGWSELWMARDARHKYVRAPRPELYDLETDPSEASNLFENEPEIGGEMGEALDTAMSDAVAEDSAARNELSPQELAKLQSLGYLRGGGAAPTGPGGSLPDPKDHIAEATRLQEAGERLDRGELDTALSMFREVIEKSPGNHTALQLKARALLRKGDLPAAEDASLVALAAAGADPSCPVALADNARALLATVLSLEGRREEAARALRSEGGKAASPAGVLMAAAKNQDDARAILKLALDHRPQDVWTWAAAEEFARRTGDSTGAAAAQQRLRGMGPEAASALVDAGARAQDAGDLHRAIALFETALSVRPHHPDVLGYLGTARLAAGDLAGAERAFLEVRSLRPADPRAPMYLANVALIRGDEAAAKARIDEALRLAPQFVPPLLDYARWLARKGRNDEAIAVARSAVARRPGDAGAIALVEQLQGSGRRGGS